MIPEKDEKEIDKNLARRAKSDPDAFGEIVNRYWDRLFRFVRRTSYFSNEDIEDILQNAFVKAYKGINGYDESMPFSAWMYQIVRNASIDEMRKRTTRPSALRLEDEELAKIFVSSIDLEKKLSAKQDLDTIRSVIETLPETYREILILRFLEEKEYEEIMDIVQKPKGTIAAVINRGRKKLLEEAGRKGITYTQPYG